MAGSCSDESIEKVVMVDAATDGAAVLVSDSIRANSESCSVQLLEKAGDSTPVERDCAPDQSLAKQRKTLFDGRLGAFSPTLFALCLAFVLVRLPFIFTIPMSEAPDEYAHFWVMRFLHDNLRLPNAAEVLAGGPTAVYGSLPPFGYIPHILVGFITPSPDLVLFARFGSLFMGLILLYCAYAIGRELFPRARLLALAVPVAVIFHPQLAFVHAYTNNDATSSAVASLILLLAIRSLHKGGFVFWRTAAIGLLTGWLALTKYSGLGILPPVALCLVASAVLNRAGIGRTAMHALSCGAIAVAVSAWWFVRNATIFSGDALGTHTMYTTWATTFHRPLSYYLPASHIIKNIRWWRMMFFSFWGLFGYMNKYMWRPIYFVYLGFLCTGLFGLIVRNGVRWATAMRQRVRVADARMTVAWLSLAAAVLINLASMIWASTTNLGGPQGRYLFTSEIPVLALMVFGLNATSERFGQKLVIGFLAFNAIVCIGAWFWLFRLYGFHLHPI